MPRKPRIEFPGAFYHVISRGNRKEDIFLDEAGKRRFLGKLLTYRNRYKFIVYAYALMDNHIHLLIETGKVPLAKIMQGLLQSHTQWHNKKYQTVGHLFQGRYTAILCDKDAYMISLVCYIHANPVRSGLVENPSEFAWSSHRSYLGIETNEIIDVEFVLGQLSKSKAQAFQLYRDLIGEYLGQGKIEEFYRLRDQRVLGSKDFFDGVMHKASQEACNLDGILRDKRLNEISKAVKTLMGITADELKGNQRNPRIMKARALFIRLAVLFTNAKREEIADFLRRKPAALSYMEQKISEGDLWKSIKKLKW